MPLLPYDYLHLVNCPKVVTISDILCMFNDCFNLKIGWMMSMYTPLDVHTLGFDMAYPAELQGLCDVALTLTRSTEMLWRLSTSKLWISFADANVWRPTFRKFNQPVGILSWIECAGGNVIKAVVTKEICANNFKYRVHPIIGRNQNRPCLPSFSQTRQRWGTEYVFLATIVACMPKLNTIFQNNFILHHRPLASCLNFVIWAKLPPIPSWMSTHWVTQVVEKNWLERRILSLILRGEYLLSSSPPHPPKQKYSNKMGLEMGKRGKIGIGIPP